MSYEGLFITNSWVTLDIPLCDHSSILMIPQLLYDYYIQLFEKVSIDFLLAGLVLIDDDILL